MLQSEFEARVQMTVPEAEYWHINEVYNNSDLDKDEFCKLWVKMNQNRVAKAKAETKAREEQEALKSKLWRILEKYAPKDYYWKEVHFADMVMTITEVKNVQKAGIPLTENGMASRLSTVLYEIRKYLKAA